ncbi:MAG TPA: hypothetical protein VJT15_25720 [Pyrinomonadaceae bacterium]|nr:hypothetical protein [Pyrinomonadaceae bacterium]
MKIKKTVRRAQSILLSSLFMLCVVSLLVPPVPVQAFDGEQFSALGVLPAGAGMRMVGPGSTMNLNIYINSYTSDADTQEYAKLLIEGGNDALLKALEKAKSIGKVQLVRRVGFFDLKLIRSRPIEGGRRIIGVCDRPVQFLEAYAGSRSLDYTFGILILDLKPNKKGREEGVGQLIYAAKVKVDGRTVEVENYGVEPARLQGVRKM